MTDHPPFSQDELAMMKYYANEIVKISNPRLLTVASPNEEHSFK